MKEKTFNVKLGKNDVELTRSEAHELYHRLKSLLKIGKSPIDICHDTPKDHISTMYHEPTTPNKNDIWCKS